jgi:hypothetical protein
MRRIVSRSSMRGFYIARPSPRQVLLADRRRDIEDSETQRV